MIVRILFKTLLDVLNRESKFLGVTNDVFI